MPFQLIRTNPLYLFFILIILASCKKPTAETEKQEFIWKTKLAEEAGFDKNVLNRLSEHVQDSTLYGVDAILVVNDNNIVFENYFNGYTIDSLHNVASVGKSVTSALVGIAIEKGFLTDNTERVIDFFRQDYKIEHLTPEKEDIQIQHLLTMSAGWACDDWDDDSPGNTMHFPAKPDDFAFTLNQPMIKPNGEHFSYCSGGANLLGEIIRQQSNLSLKDFGDKYLFNKIGIVENEWFITPTSKPYEFAGGGNSLKPRDLARFGLLYLNKGIWQGEQVISADWITESTSSQIKAGEDGDYGYLWWVKDYNYKGRSIRAFEASGNGGNKITVIPELSIVVILTGSAYGSEYVEGEQAEKIVEDYVLAAIR